MRDKGEPRILILHASVGAGHERAARATAAALALEAPDARVVVVDALDLARPLFRRVYGDGYLGLVEKAPSLFGLLFDLTDRRFRGPALGDRLRRAVQDWGAGELSLFLERQAWDAVVSTHFLPSELAAALKAAGRFRAPLMTVVTDFDAHRIWAHRPCERYGVASPVAAASLRAAGVPEEAIALTGIPIDPLFSVPLERAAARRALGLSDALPVVLQAAGGHGVGPIDSVTRELLTSPVPSQVVVLCGRNEEARRRVEALRAPARHRVTAMGFTTRVRELMAAADLLVSKPGGLTVSEALACGLPMALVRPIPGQEERNADYVVAAGAAVRAASPAGLGALVAGLLAPGPGLERMRRRAQEIGRPRSAFAAARQALELARAGDPARAADRAVAAAKVATRISHWAIPGLQSPAVAAAEAATAK